jgi:hypothetical protein
LAAHPAALDLPHALVEWVTMVIVTAVFPGRVAYRPGRSRNHPTGYSMTPPTARTWARRHRQAGRQVRDRQAGTEGVVTGSGLPGTVAVTMWRIRWTPSPSCAPIRNGERRAGLG